MASIKRFSMIDFKNNSLTLTVPRLTAQGKDESTEGNDASMAHHSLDRALPYCNTADIQL